MNQRAQELHLELRVKCCALHAGGEVVLRRARGGGAATLLSDEGQSVLKRAQWWLRHPRARGSGLRERSAFAPALDRRPARG